MERPGAVGRRAPLPDEYEDLRDLANGEKVPRCAVCGVPEKRAIVGPWSGDGQTYRFRVCARCIGKESQPNPDPLTIEAA